MQDIYLLFSDLHDKKEQDHISQQFELLLSKIGSIKRAKYKEHKNLINKPTVLVFHPDEVDDIEIIIGERNAKILIALNNTIEIKELREFHHVSDRIYGFLDLQQIDIYNLPILNNYAQQFFSIDHSSLASLSNDLSLILAQSMKELERVKEIHKEVVPMREFKSKGASSTLKFLSGEKPGGEFFDAKITDLEQWFFYVRTNSYLVSSLLISEIDVLKEKLNTSDIVKKMIEFQKEYKANIEYCFYKINIKDLTLNVWNQSSAQFYINGSLELSENFNRIEAESIESKKISLKPDSRITFVSSGYKQVYSDSSFEMALNQFLNEHSKLSSRELLNELFLTLKSKNMGMFLPYDSLVVTTKIDEKALFSI